MISTWRGSQPPRRNLHDVLQDHGTLTWNLCWNLTESKAPDDGYTADNILLDDFCLFRTMSDKLKGKDLGVGDRKNPSS